MDLKLALQFLAFASPLIASIVGGWAIMRRQGDRTERAVETLSARIDTKFEKIVGTLSSVQAVSEESMRRVMAAFVRIEEESRMAALERETRARIQEQLQAQKDVLAELKRTQELNFRELRNDLTQRKGVTEK